MHVFILLAYFAAALAFGFAAFVGRSVLAAGLLCWILVYLVPMLVH